MTKKILLVEDEFSLGELYQMILIRAGYEVTWAKDGQEGIEKATAKPDLILLDIMMPKMNGIEVLRHLKANEQTRALPVILLSNLAQEDVIKQAFELGANGYLLKIDMLPGELIRQISSFFEHPDVRVDPKQIGDNSTPQG